MGVDSNGAVVIGTAAGTSQQKPAAPSATHASLGDLASGRPRLAFTLTAASTAPTLSKLKLSLPAGLRSATSEARLNRGITVRGPSGAHLRFSASSAHGALTIALKAPAAKVTLTLSSPAITAGRSLVSKVKRHALSSIKITVSATDAAGDVWPLTLKLAV